MHKANNEFVFASKGATLANLKDRISSARLCDQIIVDAMGWKQNSEAALKTILDTFPDDLLAIRSSAVGEDSFEQSKAGAFLSITNVPTDTHSIESAINQVFASYGEAHERDEVLVQPMVENVVISGVVLTRDLDTGSPYLVVNYDDTTGRTDTVTGGAESKVIYIHRTHTDAVSSERFKKLIQSISDIEYITSADCLDIEFCITANDDVYILQVRPLAAQKRWELLPESTITTTINEAYAGLTEKMVPKPGLSGKTTFFSDMTDWNPAEMIGSAPRPLALSLYRYLITDQQWAEARALMGYRNVQAPLLTTWCGKPYVDVRLSLNSFLPENLSAATAEILINHQLEYLSTNRDLHDKIEFAVATTCRDFNFERTRERLQNIGLSKAQLHELEVGLHAITLNAIAGERYPINVLLKQANSLLTSAKTPKTLSDIAILLENCKSNGTLPFAMLARHGFIAVHFLKSMVQQNIVSRGVADRLMRGIHTVAADVVSAMTAVSNGDMEVKEFLHNYGHLRPGTYDINSPRYDEQVDVFLTETKLPGSITHEPYKPASSVLSSIEKALNISRFDISPEDFLTYISDAISAREQAKFAFTRSLSDSLKALTAWGENIGLSRDDVSFLSIEFILTDPDVHEAKTKIEAARSEYKVGRSIRLPQIICDPDDIFVVRVPLGQPTFITNHSVTKPVKVLFDMHTTNIDGHIVLIESADPGFDWIFSHSIAGLITKYGGANSHMAIRCAEFNLPAAIGCGDQLFEKLRKAHTVELNCGARTVKGRR